MLSILINLLLAIHVIVSLLIVLIVLMQRPKNEGLGAAFGGGMTENMFGAQTTNVLAKITRWLGGLFFILTLSLSVLYAKQSRDEDPVSQTLRDAPQPEASAAPMASPAAEASAVAPEAELQASPEEMTEPAATSSEPAVEATPAGDVTPAEAPAETPAASAVTPAS